MALKLRLDPQAKRDLDDIRTYLVEEAGADRADRVRAHIQARVNRLRESPLIGVATSEPSIRVLPPVQYPYRIFYTITEDAVVILHVRHSARKDPNIDALRRNLGIQ